MKPYILFLALPFVAHAACELNQNKAGEYEVATYADLQLVGVEDCSLDADYRLVKDIDATESKDNLFALMVTQYKWKRMVCVLTCLETE